MAYHQTPKESKLLTVIVHTSKPDDARRPLPRIARYPAKMKVELSSFTRRSFDRINFLVQDSTTVPNPNATLREHQTKTFHELRQNRKHFGEAWVQDAYRSPLIKINEHCGYKPSCWYEPMMRLLKGYKIKKLVIARDAGS